jgi:hypothetical protein
LSNTNLFCVVLCRSLFVFSVVCIAQCLVFCVVFCRSLFVFSVVCVDKLIYTTLHRTLNIKRHKPHWKQTMIYTTLHRTLNIEQHKPHWKQTMIFRTLERFILKCDVVFFFLPLPALRWGRQPFLRPLPLSKSKILYFIELSPWPRF